LRTYDSIFFVILLPKVCLKPALVRLLLSVKIFPKQIQGSEVGPAEAADGSETWERQENCDF